MDDPGGSFWDAENSGVYKAAEFIECLEVEFLKAFPGRKMEIHAFGVDGVTGTERLRDWCREDNRIQDHFLTAIKGEDDEAQKDRADYKLVTEMFLFAMRNRSAPIILLIGGDDDFTNAMLMLDEQGYMLASASSGNTAKELKEACRQLPFQWNSFKNVENQNKKRIRRGLPAMEAPVPEVQDPKEDTEVGKVLKAIIKKHAEKQSAPKKAKTELEEIKRDNSMGVFVDVDSNRITAAKHNALLIRLKAYAKGLKKHLLTTHFYGDASNFSRKAHDGTTNTVTSRRKHFKLVNKLMAGLGKFAIDYGSASTVLVMTDNIKFATIIEGFHDAGFDIILVTKEDKKESELWKLVKNKILSHYTWKLFAPECLED